MSSPATPRQRWRRAYGLFRYWRYERDCCCRDPAHNPSDAYLFCRAAARVRLAAGLAERIALSCFTAS